MIDVIILPQKKKKKKLVVDLKNRLIYFHSPIQVNIFVMLHRCSEKNVKIMARIIMIAGWCGEQYCTEDLELPVKGEGEKKEAKQVNKRSTDLTSTMWQHCTTSGASHITHYQHHDSADWTNEDE